MAESTLSDVNRPKSLSSDTVMGVSSKSLYSGPQYNDVPRDWLKSQRYIVIVSFETNPCFNDIGEKQSQLFRSGVYGIQGSSKLGIRYIYAEIWVLSISFVLLTTNFGYNVL